MIRISSIIVSLALFAPAFAQEAKPEPKPEAKPSQSAQPADHEPTLDELLGIKPTSTPPSDPTPPDPDAKPTDPAKAELERQLSTTEIAEAFEQAVGLMSQTAERLPSDTGLTTQRMQEDIIRKLDTLIDQAQKQQSKSKSKNKKPQDQSQQQQQQQQQSSQQQSKTSEPQQGANVPKADGQLNTPPGGVAKWGNLPEHEREALTQGMTDKFSSMYKSATEKYYKRLAEEPKAGDAATPTTPTTPTSPRP